MQKFEPGPFVRQAGLRVRQLDPLQFVRQAGFRVASKGAADRLSSRRVYLGLRCDLSELPEPRPGKVPIEMVARDAPTFRGFTDELQDATGSDYVQVLLRTWMCANDVRALYAAEADDGRPIYAQWLVRQVDQQRLQADTPDAHDELADDEVLLEGAYTFVAFRGVGAMADGMGQLLRIARDEGSAAAITYVRDDNIPSLRGCARVGFVLDHVRVNSTRLGRGRSDRSEIESAAQQAWESAVGSTVRT
jgi:hypothetical protein